MRRTALTLALGVLLLTACGATKTVTVTAAKPSTVVAAHPLSLAQLARISRDVSKARKLALDSPDLFAPIAETELSWKPGDRGGTVDVRYTYLCSTADYGYEQVAISPGGRERVVTPPTSASDPNVGTLCTN